MGEIYGKDYYDHYDVGVDKVDYKESEYTKGFLTGIAERIVQDLHPQTVLDAGCAMGHLVAALRDRGVEAYGIDISEYAVSCVREDIQPYCVSGSIDESLPDSLPSQFDLIVSIEVLEHLYEEDGKRAIQNLCKYTDQFLFCSTPDDFDDPTHLNVRQREYWARCFAEAGFYDDVNYRPTFLTYYAFFFRRSDNLFRQIEDYERNIRVTEAVHKNEVKEWSKAVEDKERHIQNQNRMLEAERSASASLRTEMEQIRGQLSKIESDLNKVESELEETQEQLSQSKSELEETQEQLSQSKSELEETQKHLHEVEAELAHYQEHYHAAIAQREELKRQLAEAQNAYNTISNAACWKITKPLRVILDAVKRVPGMGLIIKGIKSLKNNGFKYTWQKVKSRNRLSKQAAEMSQKPLFTEEELEKQRKEQFPRKVKFSVVVPLYNTPERFLREMIESVQDQTYSDWELCMADGSDENHGDVERICRSYMKKDSRIRYKKLDKNYGISGNTNACLEMAEGDYIGLFDHDDLLHPAALHEVMKAICEKNADFIYTDENTFHNTPEDAYCPHFKPDYAPDTLRGVNYICHFTSFRKSLLEKAGLFRPECDGSQDFDMVLRLTEQAEHIVHIPEILYFWRAHPNSVADSVGAKPYVIQAAHKAIEDHLSRIGLEGEILDSVVPSMYRIKYAVKGNPLVSILIPNYEHQDDLKRCIESIEEKSTYQNYEIIVIENNSKNPETFAYYETIQKQWDNVRVIQWESVFNYSAINNFGAQHCTGDYLLLLNNDTEVISLDWIQEMLMFAQRQDVGAVGAKLYYPDDTIQHAGVILGIGGVGGHAHKYFPRNDHGYMGRLIYAQNLSAVTAACVMIRRDVWEQIGGLDESFAVAFNDVDLCMRIRKAGYLIVWTPFAELYHYESKSRGLEDTPEKRKRFEGEVRRFQERWAKELAEGDPYYNPNFTLDREDFSFEPVLRQHKAR